MSDTQTPQPIPNLVVPQQLFVLSTPSLSALHAKSREAFIKGVEEDEMGPYYASLASSSAITLDQTLLSSIQAKNDAKLKELDTKIEDVKKEEGESEIGEALRKRADYLTRIGDKDRALDAQKLALEKTPGLGSRIDIVLTIVRIGFFFSDTSLVVEWMAKAEKLIDEGGDWDRRNRLKVYRALHLLSIRSFAPASALLLDALSTFTATELMSFADVVTYTVLCGCLTLTRVELKKKILGSPEIKSLSTEIPVLEALYKNLWESRYDGVFAALATLEQTVLLPSRYLAPHARFYVREMRIRSYAQLLESYRSLTIASLGRAFGVSEDFVDTELSRFIASGRIHARIDKVNGVVETTRPSSKTAAYELAIKKGDVLLNEMQRLSKVLH